MVRDPAARKMFDSPHIFYVCTKSFDIKNFMHGGSNKKSYGVHPLPKKKKLFDH